MSIYLVALTEPDETMYERVKEQGRAFRLSPTLFLVNPEVSSQSTLLEQLEIKNEANTPSALIVDMVKGGSVGLIPKGAADWYNGVLEIESRE